MARASGPDHVSRAILVLMGTVVLGAGAIILMQLQGFRSVGCSSSCDHRMYAVAGYGLIVTVILAVGLGAAGVIVAKDKGRSALIGPVIGAVVVVVASVVLLHVGGAALTRT